MDLLPSLGALRVFEAAARLGSFQLAAGEMNLTPSAISYQIRNLETSLGQPLFVRQHRKVTLTAAGATLQQYVRRGFDELRHGAAAVRLVRDPRVLRVTAAPAFASAFLTHRLGSFERANPSVELQLVIATTVMDLVGDGLDAAVRFSVDPPADLHAEELLGLEYTPMGTPAIAAELSSPADAAQVTRIVVREHDQGWDQWFAGLDAVPPGGRTLHVETMIAGIQAALDGLGLALVPRGVVARHVRDGRLVAPFGHMLVSRYRYWLVCRRGDEHSAKIRRFARWLHGEVDHRDDE